MQINDELVISTIAAASSMLLLKFTEYFMKKKQDDDDDVVEAINTWHDDVQKELAAVKAENRLLREDSDRYRELYHQLLVAEVERAKPRTELTRKDD
jgi:hypothetical protein